MMMIIQKMKETHRNIRFKPEDFPDYLTTNLKFELLDKMEVASETNIAEGFKRPIYIFKKLPNQ
jgi:hypothetical protein